MNKDLLKKKILSEISNSSFVYAPYQGWWDDADIEKDLEEFEEWIDEPAIRDEHLWAGLGLGMRFDFTEWARWKFIFRSEYDIPHHLDQRLPDVYQGADTVHFEVGTSLVFAIP